MQVDCNKIVENKKGKYLWEAIGRWADSEQVVKNIKSPYQAAMAMFESRFQIPMEYAVLLSPDSGGPFLTKGNITGFVKDLYSYAKRVDSGKLSAFESLEGFMTGTVLGKRDPALRLAINDIRSVVESNDKRDTNLRLQFNEVLSLIKQSGGINGKYEDFKLKRAIKKHRELELDYIKALDSNSKDIDEKYDRLVQFETSGKIKSFTDFIRVVENDMSKVVLAKYNSEKRLAETDTKGLSKEEVRKIKNAKSRVERYDKGDLLVKLSREADSRFYEEAGIDPSIIPALDAYHSMMNYAYDVMRAGIKKKTDNYIKILTEREGIGENTEFVENIRESMLSNLMPKYIDEGYFPHFTRQLSTGMMDKMMSKFDDLDKSFIDMKHDSLSTRSLLKSINESIPSYAKTRNDENNDYSKNFVDVINTYLHDVNKFNTEAFMKGALLNSHEHAMKIYGDESDYSAKIVDTINSLYGSVNGTIQNSGSMHEIKKALLSYQFTNKLGFSIRSAARNATQYLMNYATFGFTAVKESRRFLKENKTLENFPLSRFLEDENLLMDTSEAIIESGVKGKITSPYRIRRMDENGKIYYGDENKFVYNGLKIFSGGVGKLAQASAVLHRKVENANRKLTAEIAFAQMYKVMNESGRFQTYLSKKFDGNKDKITSKKRELAKTYAKNMVIMNHFDYQSYAKAKNMREGIGQFAFQFQHYGMEFLERNYSIFKEGLNDLSVGLKGEDSFSTWAKDARGVHKSMSLSTAYFLAPAIISYISGYNQTLIEHTGKEFMDDLVLLFTTDINDKEELEKLNREFYGKGIVGSKLGPTFGTLLDVGVMTELINADNEYFNNLLITVDDYSNDDTMDTAIRYIKLLNQMAGRMADRYIPMTTKTPYGIGAAALQEITLYPKKKDEQTLYRNIIEPTMKGKKASVNVLGMEKKFDLQVDKIPVIGEDVERKLNNYYFDKLQKKSKRKKITTVPPELRQAFLMLEKEGK